MGDNYVELMWRVVVNRVLKAAFDDLEDAEAFAKTVGGEVYVVQSKLIRVAQ